MTTTTAGKANPATTFTLVEMETPESVASGDDLNVTVRFSGNPIDLAWQIIRDLDLVEFKTELVADTIGPGLDVSLNGPDGAVTPLVVAQDDYEVAINVPGGGALDPGLYEIGAVITFRRTDTGNLVPGIAAFAGDAVMQVR